MPLLALLWLAGCGTRPPANVLLITLDTTRADMLGAYGNPTAQTPTLDRLATEGVRFDRAYTVTPLTIPAHSSIMTGLWPPRHGVRDNGDFFLGPEAHTLAEILGEHGYATMASVGAEVTSHHWGFAQGFNVFFDEMGKQDTDHNRWRVERRADAVIADAQGWLDQQSGPWFAWVHLFDAHHPYEPPEPYRSRFPGRPYQGEIAWVDSQVGALLDHLKSKGALENTWIVVSGDHGEGLGSHGEQMHGVLLYDATTHIPLIIRPPSGRTAKTVKTPVSLVDLLPTILGATGIPVPPGLDGVDQSPLVRGDGDGDPSRVVYAESLYAFHHYGWAQQKALVTNDNKLIDSTTPEVYGREDLSESQNLVPSKATLLQTLEAQLQTLQGAMVPLTEPPRATLSAERTAQLEALGYLSSDATPTQTTGLPDPVQHLPSLTRLEDARRALQANDLDRAKAAAEAVIAVEPGLAEAQMTLATVLLRQGHLQEAYAIAAAQDARNPGSQTRMMMGTIKLQSGEPEEGIALLGQALEKDPYLENAWMLYLRALLLHGEASRFATEAAKARVRLPDSVDVGGMAGVALALNGRFPQAEPLLLPALAANPSGPFLNYALGITRRSQRRTDEAETYLTEEVRLFPPSVASRKVLVEILADQKRYAEQLEQLTAIAAVEPPSAPTFHSIAQALFNLHRYEEAYKEVQNCERIAPKYAACVMLEANVLKKLGKEAEAQAAYQRALGMVPK